MHKPNLFTFTFLLIQELVASCQFQPPSVLICKGVNSSEGFRNGIGIFGPKTKRLIFTDSYLEYLTPDIFENVPNVKNINFYSCNIRNFHKNAFRKLNKLEVITVEDCLLITIESAFSNLERLKTLKLESNKLAVLPRNPFQNDASLTEIKMDNMELTNIDFASFSNRNCNLSSLLYLSFRKNVIVNLSNYTFYGLHKLKSLELQENHLRTLPQNAFTGLYSLTLLNLSSNSIDHLLGGLFQNTPKLKHLYLDNNQIQFLTRNMFEGLGKLETLYLQFNGMDKIASDAFDYLKVSQHLRKLHIFGNRINYQVRTFDKFDSLVELIFDSIYSSIEADGIYFSAWKEPILSLP